MIVAVGGRRAAARASGLQTIVRRFAAITKINPCHTCLHQGHQHPSILASPLPVPTNLQPPGSSNELQTALVLTFYSSIVNRSSN